VGGGPTRITDGKVDRGGGRGQRCGEARYSSVNFSFVVEKAQSSKPADVQTGGCGWLGGAVYVYRGI